MSQRKFFLTTFKVTVLSEGTPLTDDIELGELHYAVSEGDCVLHGYGARARTLRPRQAAQLLIEAGSEPGFFNLDDDGYDTEAF